MKPRWVPHWHGWCFELKVIESVHDVFLGISLNIFWNLKDVEAQVSASPVLNTYFLPNISQHIPNQKLSFKICSVVFSPKKVRSTSISSFRRPVFPPVLQRSWFWVLCWAVCSAVAPPAPGAPSRTAEGRPRRPRGRSNVGPLHGRGVPWRKHLKTVVFETNDIKKTKSKMRGLTLKPFFEVFVLPFWSFCEIWKILAVRTAKQPVSNLSNRLQGTWV